MRRQVRQPQRVFFCQQRLELRQTAFVVGFVNIRLYVFALPIIVKFFVLELLEALKFIAIKALGEIQSVLSDFFIRHSGSVKRLYNILFMGISSITVLGGNPAEEVCHGTHVVQRTCIHVKELFL